MEHRGFAVDLASTGQDAINALEMTRYDAIILDLGLPDMDGLKVLAARNSSRQGPVPCIVLTARDALESKVAGLNAGADDYVLKPVNMAELEARIRAVLRRSGWGFVTMEHGNLSYDPQSHHVTVSGVMLPLPRREAMLLEELVRSAPRLVLKDTIDERLYGDRERGVTLNAIEALISRLRRKLELAGATVRIDTVRGLGYRLVTEVECSHACT
ncbi:Transcriptional regulatory protein QseB [Oligella sp. MSHR50489EDL]|uniref:response regulator transcription factor n=1 Tax=Oligella sp. MSHR50489EDL TaxID=3139409 RepID=UPI003D81A5BF